MENQGQPLILTPLSQIYNLQKPLLILAYNQTLLKSKKVHNKSDKKKSKKKCNNKRRSSHKLFHLKEKEDGLEKKQPQNNLKKLNSLRQLH